MIHEPARSSGAVFAIVDNAARPGVQFPYRQEGEFSAGRGNSPLAGRRGKYEGIWLSYAEQTVSLFF
jgi:hypothetical protein